jgi:hypothetical protein
MTVTQRVNLVRNAEEHIRALTAVIDFLAQSPIFGSDDQLVKFLKWVTMASRSRASKGEQVPASVDTGATVITKANMNSARSQELLNPRIK